MPPPSPTMALIRRATAGTAGERSVPRLHVLPDSWRDARPVVVRLVELRVDMVHDGAEVALHGVEVDRALAIGLHAVVEVGDAGLDSPVADPQLRAVYQGANRVGGERPAVGEHPVVVALRHRPPRAVLLLHHRGHA